MIITKKIILCSSSKIRQKMMKDVFGDSSDIDVISPSFDEEKGACEYWGNTVKKEKNNQIIAHTNDSGAKELVKHISRQKIQSVLQNHAKKKNCIYIAADSILFCDERIWRKSKNQQELFEKINAIQGKKITIYVGVNISREGEETPHSFVTEGHCFIKKMTNEDIHHHIQHYGEKSVKSVTGFRMEKEGLFYVDGDIEGDYFSLLGFPLLKIIQEISK